jgi:hypothetical protein
MKKNTYRVTIAAFAFLASGAISLHADEKVTEVTERTRVNQNMPSPMISPNDDMMDVDMELGMNQPTGVVTKKTEQRYVRSYDDNNNPVVVRRYYTRPVRRYYDRPYRRYYYERPSRRYYEPRRYRRYYYDDDYYYDDGYYYDGRDRAGRVIGGAATGALIGGIAGGRGAGIGAGVGAGLGLFGP